MEGPNAIGKAHRYYVKGWSEFYWLPPSAQQCLFKVDDAGVVQGRYDCSKDDAGNFLPPIESIVFIDSLVHIQLYHYNHNQQEEKTSVAAVLDTVHKVVKQFSFYHPSKPTMDDLYKGRLRAGDEYVSCLFDGANFVYVFGQNDSIYVATADHKNVKGYNAKSKYLKPAKYIPKPHYAALNDYLRESNQQQFYHYIYYDKYREVYYRLAYPESEVDPKENQQDIWSFGRRTCSIVILDKNFRIIGETLLPDYRYQNRSIVVLKDGLYICDNHYKREDYDENVWSFQRFDLMKKK